jgi:hypothetical protein
MDGPVGWCAWDFSRKKSHGGWGKEYGRSRWVGRGGWEAGRSEREKRREADALISRAHELDKLLKI